MKLLPVISCLLLLVGCERSEIPVGEECRFIDSRIQGQLTALAGLTREIANAQDDRKGIYEKVDAVVSDQQALLDSCMAAAVEAGPGCREVGQLGGVMDSKVLLESVTPLLAKQPNGSQLASEFLGQARRALEADVGQPRCFAE